jgi:hypothetical protein
VLAMQAMEERPGRESSKALRQSKRSQSGEEVCMTNDELLVQFLYILLRDHLPAGTVEQIIVDHVAPSADLEVKYSNEFLEGYAREIAGRLRPV